MQTVTAEQIAKLPKWAQDHIRNITRERDIAVQELNAWVDSQTPSAFYVDEYPCIGEQKHKRRYFQGNRIAVDHAGVHCEILLAREDDGQRLYGIDITYSEGGPRRIGHQDVAIMPRASNCIELVAKDNMR